MPVEKINFRLNPRDMCRPEDGTFQTHYEARVGRPLDDIDLDEVFQDVGQGRLEPGDQVTFCAFDGSMLERERRLREIGICRVVAKILENGRPKIKAVWVGEIYKVPAQALPAKGEGREIKKLEIVKEFGAGFMIKDDKGHVLERVNTKAEAETFIAAYGRPIKAKETKAAVA